MGSQILICVYTVCMNINIYIYIIRYIYIYISYIYIVYITYILYIIIYIYAYTIEIGIHIDCRYIFIRYRYRYGASRRGTKSGAPKNPAGSPKGLRDRHRAGRLMIQGVSCYGLGQKDVIVYHYTI